MQLIYSSKHTANFTVISNTLLASTIPPKAQKVLLYLLSKPRDWKLNLIDLKKRLALSTYGARQALRWLTENGYACYERLKSGHTTWRVYDTPQTSTVNPCVEIPQVVKQSVLPRTEKILNTTTDVVVDNVVIPDIPGIKPSQQKAANKLLSGLDKTAITAILLIFNTALQTGRVGNPVGYLHKLVQAAQDGTLTTPTTNAPPEPLEQRVKRQQAEQRNALHKVDNNSHFNNLIATYGSKVARYISI